MILKISPVSSTSIRIDFKESLPKDFLDLDNYCFTNGVLPLAVMVVGEKSVEVMTTQQEPDKKYGISYRAD